METRILFLVIAQREKQNLHVTGKGCFEYSGTGDRRHFVVIVSECFL